MNLEICNGVKMIIAEKRKLLTVLIFSFILILGTAVWGYKIGMKYGLKGNAELVLFLGFIGAGLQLITSISILLYAQKKQKDFYMLMDTIKSSGMLSEKKAKILGSAGIELQKALTTAHEITMQKSLKIASLHGLVKILTEMTDQQLLIISLTGEILEASSKAQTETNLKKGDDITNFFPNLDVRLALKKASVTRLPVEQDDKIIFIPVFSTIGDISFFIVDISKQGIFAKFIDKFKYTPKEEPEKKRKTKFFNILQK